MSKMLDNMINLRLDKTAEALKGALDQVAQIRKHPSDMLYACQLIEQCTAAQKMSHQVHGIVSRLDSEAYKARKSGPRELSAFHAKQDSEKGGR